MTFSSNIPIPLRAPPPRQHPPYNTLHRLEQYHSDLEKKHARLRREFAELIHRRAELEHTMTSEHGAGQAEDTIAQDMLQLLRRKAESVRANADIVGRLAKLIKERVDSRVAGLVCRGKEEGAGGECEIVLFFEKGWGGGGGDSKPGLVFVFQMSISTSPIICVAATEPAIQDHLPDEEAKASQAGVFSGAESSVGDMKDRQIEQ
ncbi:hypothetical protein BC938DRAFT_478237 [Jimgerdemannia flammicorona]|uniref:Uncharacterized protein n=1 Tax=Jimgerdemannia flammicorona TaxID=994334 RepID=A0A433QYJ6_9FUNG|nr:hypothetical protein BC938DRAFT_478237 [Jimgerdemannia flammicorona]